MLQHGTATRQVVYIMSDGIQCSTGVFGKPSHNIELFCHSGEGLWNYAAHPVICVGCFQMQELSSSDLSAPDLFKPSDCYGYRRQRAHVRHAAAWQGKQAGCLHCVRRYKVRYGHVWEAFSQYWLGFKSSGTLTSRTVCTQTRGGSPWHNTYQINRLNLIFRERLSNQIFKKEILSYTSICVCYTWRHYWVHLDTHPHHGTHALSHWYIPHGRGVTCHPINDVCGVTHHVEPHVVCTVWCDETHGNS